MLDSRPGGSTRPPGRSRRHTRPGWWQQRAAANAALAMREFVDRVATGTTEGRTPDELVVVLSAGLAAVLDTHHPDERGRCAACSHLSAPWRWVLPVRWPCPPLRTLTRELDHVTEDRR